jgi:sec-independent protein translocase protein TatC
MSAVIRNSQSSKVGKSVEIILFFLVVVSIMITPPDFILDILVIIPLLVLYELSVTISKIAYKKKVVSDASM